MKFLLIQGLCINLQVYKGLNIITAKVTEEEKKMVPHHMLDILDPLNHNYTVVQFRDMAIPIVIFPFFFHHVRFFSINRDTY